MDTNKTEIEEHSKYTHLKALHDPDSVEFYTEWLNQEEVFRANKILLLSNWAIKIFGDSKGVIDGTQFMRDHLEEHMLHMTAHKRKRAHESVFATRPDGEIAPNSKTINRAFGMR